MRVTNTTAGIPLGKTRFVSWLCGQGQNHSWEIKSIWQNWKVILQTLN